MIGLSVMSPRSIEEIIFTIELNVERGRYDRSEGGGCFFNLNGIFFYRLSVEDDIFMGPFFLQLHKKYFFYRLGKMRRVRKGNPMKGRGF